MVSTIENENDSIAENLQPVKKLKTSNGGYKAPTADEMYNLKNTESLYQSNLFRLQVICILKSEIIMVLFNRVDLSKSTIILSKKSASFTFLLYLSLEKNFFVKIVYVGR
jgi:hypothetical protein